jgi:hypothetical protein
MKLMDSLWRSVTALPGKVLEHLSYFIELAGKIFFRELQVGQASFGGTCCLHLLNECSLAVASTQHL